MKRTLLILAISIIAAACGDSNKLSFDSVESGRKQANENSLYTATQFRQNNPQYAGFSLSMRGDSAQSAECGQGDGWASIDLVKPDTKQTVKLKCSTVSESIGCRTDEDFKSSPYASQDGRCNTEIPFPLPKIQK
jgi:hypothetical protein